MAALFPDAYSPHIGGDENNGRQWNANLAIQQYIRDHGLKDNAGLHAYFNTRVNASCSSNTARSLVGWDEILHPELLVTSVIHSWRGRQGIANATQRGYARCSRMATYVDLIQPASVHYLNDPVPANSGLTEAQEQLVLGGEGDDVGGVGDTRDHRLPHLAAHGRHRGAPPEVAARRARRAGHVSPARGRRGRRLEEIGLRHDAYLEPALRLGLPVTGRRRRRILAALRVFVDLLEPVKDYQRGKHQPNATQFTPLTGLVDCARPDSASARQFAALIGQYLADPRSPDAAAPVAGILTEWHGCAEQLLARLPLLAPQRAGAQPLLQAWRVAHQPGD